MSTEIFKISYFSFTLKLNAKKKLPLKISDLERRGCKKIFAGGGVMFHKGGGRGAWQEGSGLKISGWVVTTHCNCANNTII